MRTFLAATVSSILMVSVCGADDRQYFIDALTRIRSEMSATETSIYDRTSPKNFPANFALGTTSDSYRNIEVMEHQIDAALQYNARLITQFQIMHVRIINMNSVLADRQRDLLIKHLAADEAFQPIYTPRGRK